MGRRSSLLVSTVFALAIAALATPACSNQGEGERCDKNNANDDCTSGLSCQDIEGQPSSLCCPPAGQAISSSACLASKPKVDAGVDAAPEASVDAAVEADAAVDAANVDAAAGD